MSQSIPSHLLFKTDNFRNEDQKRNVMSFNPHQDPFCILTHHPSEITVTDQSQQSSLSSSSLDYAFPPPSITTNSMIQQARRNSASILLSTNSNFVSPQSNMIPFYHEQQRSMSVSYMVVMVTCILLCNINTKKKKKKSNTIDIQPIYYCYLLDLLLLLSGILL
ncbi:MAG: hypothetical protein EXX96DRAFT_249531 [Benjaminiella poitrasii]|nr:MAG: hypothetical protein EXX96DRAFT_249531 [Benjaminiella poitrasii]